MSLFGWLAAVVLFLQLPIPIYWFVVHPFGAFWRRRRGAAFAAGLLVSSPPVTAFLIFCRRSLFRAEGPSVAAAVVGVLLILFEIWIFQRVGRDLGAARLVGKTELSGSGELAERGIYGRIRHPRYAGSFLAVIGASLLAGSRPVWIIAAVWAELMFVAILMEEKELAGRFGDAYRDYCRRVPRFIPEWRGVAKLQ